MKDTTSVGNTSTAFVLSGLMKMGKRVLLPFGDAPHYDLVFEESGKFFTVQVKTAVYKEGAIRFKLYTVVREDGQVKNRTYGEEINFFGVYCPELNKTYLVPRKELGAKEASLRIDEVKNNRVQGVRHAKDYEI